MTSPALAPPSSTASDQPAEASREARAALSESILARLPRCRSVRERRRLRQDVVLLNLALADGIAARYTGRGDEWDDLGQVARVGLLKDSGGYRHRKGGDFAARASAASACVGKQQSR